MKRPRPPAAESWQGGPVRGFVATLLAEEAAGGALLGAALIAAVLWASLSPGSYHRFVSAQVHIPSIPLSVVNDVGTLVANLVMVVFFAAIGLEIGRERSVGSLSEPATAGLPVAAALGGMAAAALVYLAIALGSGGHGVAGGWGIPMATDVAFTLGALSLLGRRVSTHLRVFLLTLAVADDVASVIVLALVGHQGSSLPLGQRLACAGVALGVVGGALAVRRRYRGVALWIALTGVLWWLLCQLHLEPTLAGVIIGVLVLSGADPTSPGLRLERRVAPLSAFVVLPLFALTAGGVDLVARPWSGNGGVIIALLGARVIGKAVGIVGVSALVVRLGFGRLPPDTSWRQMIGAGVLCGIGFTVPLLFAAQQFSGQPGRLAATKVALLAASMLCTAVGLVILMAFRPRGETRDSV